MVKPAHPIALIGIGTAVPPFRIAQSEAAQAAQALFGGRYAEFDRLRSVFESTGIEARYSVLPLERFFQPLNWAERSEAYLEGACALFIDAAKIALDNAGLPAAAIDCIVTVSSTGIATPSLEARVASHMGFRPDVQRVPIFGLGCAGGVLGLSLAADLARAQKGRRVLLVAIETCTLAFRADRLTKENIVATALFGDGAAAIILENTDDSDVNLVGEASHQWPDTLSIMGWRVDEEGFGVIFDRSIPAFILEQLRPTLDIIAPDRPERFIFHPGGTKVISAIETSLDLPEGTLQCERHVLREFGNMSSPTVLFVLERALRDDTKGVSALTALGPGFSLALALMSRT